MNATDLSERTNKSSALDLAIEALSRTRDSTAREVAQREAELRFAESQQQQLTSYEAETLEKWAVRGAGGTSQAVLMHHQAFVGKLHDAMDMQAGVIDQRRRGVEEARARLIGLEQRIQGLSRYRDRIVAQSSIRRQRQEQKQSDEWVSNRIGRTPGLPFRGDTP